MLIQIIIALTGVISIWLSQDNNPRRKYACIIGLIGQPFWFYHTYTTQQWGIFLLSFFYTAAWMNGVYNYWIKPAK
ncbi:MAG: hypothetical protein EOO68_04945 [Moraxellaceae bacterium]|nr:MAG: hypothetical protein EOO68_04945 [Moraxellaceae bacterium]